MVCHFLLQEIFPTQGLNLGLRHCRQTLYHLSHQGSLTSSGDTQTQFCLSVCRASGSWCTQGMFEPSKHLWRVWGLILNAILPLLLSCWGFSFALGHGVSPQRMHEIQLHFACHENKQKNMSNNEDKSQSIRTDSERTQI